MNLSPGTRNVLTVIATVVAVGGGVLVTLDGIPDWVGVTVSGLGTIFAALGIVPAAVGGTQQGVANPSVVDRPPSENIKASERGEIDVITVGAILGIAAFVLVLVILL